MIKKKKKEARILKKNTNFKFKMVVLNLYSCVRFRKKIKEYILSKEI